MIEHYPLTICQPVAWGEMDAFQHVNNSVYFRYFESARMAYFERMGIMAFLKQYQMGPILASASCNFKVPLTYPDTIKIAASIDQIWEKRFNMHTVVYSETLNKIAAEGEAIVVYYDYNRSTSCKIPDKILESIERFEQGVEVES